MTISRLGGHLAGSTLVCAALFVGAHGVAADGSSAAISAMRPIVRVSITDIAVQDGFVMVALYDEDGWGGDPVDAIRAAVTADIAEVALTAPGAGQYGIQAFHDVDGDGSLDANIMGVPTEPFGFSNNAAPRFGPPSFSAAAFQVAADGAEQSIRLR